jgi:transposase-like protein
MVKERRRFEAAEKVKIIREHLLDGKPLSQVCEKYGIAPTQFYQWQKQFFENGASAFEKTGKGRNDSQSKKLLEKVSRLQAKLANKDEVIAEIMASHIELKKSLGEV